MHATARHRARGLATASLTTLALAVVALGGAPTASAAADRGLGVTTLSAVDGAQQQAAVDFWTPERIAAARPATAGDITATGVAGALTPAQTGSPAAPQTVPEGAPAPAAPGPGVSTLAAGDTPTVTRGTRQAAGVVTGAAVTQSTTWTQPSPATSKVGRLYFSLPNVKTGRLELFECSASSVTSANESVLVTAGHCLTQNGRTSQNVVFIPGLNGQSQPHGTWSAQTTFATPQWTSGNQATAAALNYDVGFVVLARKGGQTLSDTVGSFGIGFGAPLDRVTVFGYPAASGNVLKYCTGYRFSDPADTTDQGTMCTMSGGSSGGPWLSGLDAAAGTGTVTSVVSFSYDASPQVLYGPLFGDVVKAQYDRAQAVPVS